MDHSLFILSPGKGHLGYFWLLAITNKAAMNVHVQIFVSACLLSLG